MDSSTVRRNNICRTCLSEGTNYKSLLSKMNEDDRTICEILSFVTSIDISISEEYPKQVCNECYTMIYKADEFKKRCIQSESLLKSGILTSSFDELIKNEMMITTEIPIENLNDNTYNYLKKTPQSPEHEIPLIDNLDLDSNNYKYCVIKEENDEHNDGQDLHSSDIDQSEYAHNETNICVCGFLSINNSDYESHTSECKLLADKYEKHIKLICPMCKETFTNLDTLEEHIQSHKEVNGTCKLACPMCKRKCETNSSLISHLNIHRNKTSSKYRKTKSDYNGFFIPLNCTKCDSQFTDLALLSSHMKIHVDEKVDTIEVKNYHCSLCMRRFASKKSLIVHLKRHEDKAKIKLNCDICKREFQYQSHLDNHISLVHSKEKGFMCDKCGKKFSKQESYDRHIEGHQNKKHQCKVCGKTFTVLSSLNEHMRTHTGERPFLCSICGRGFSQRNNLSQHMRRHQGLKPFKCDICERGFVSKGELESHNRKHSGAHPFVCDECGNGFTTSSSLTKHRRIHSGERPYACDLCPMRFAVLGTLKNHRRTHTGEKPYQCSHCEKAFIQKSDLVSHIRCHTGERPFICTNCGQAFRMASALKVHLKMHGKETMVM